MADPTPNLCPRCRKPVTINTGQGFCACGWAGSVKQLAPTEAPIMTEVRKLLRELTAEQRAEIARELQP